MDCLLKRIFLLPKWIRLLILGNCLLLFINVGLLTSQDSFTPVFTFVMPRKDQDMVEHTASLKHTRLQLLKSLGVSLLQQTHTIHKWLQLEKISLSDLAVSLRCIVNNLVYQVKLLDTNVNLENTTDQRLHSWCDSTSLLLPSHKTVPQLLQPIIQKQTYRNTGDILNLGFSFSTSPSYLRFCTEYSPIDVFSGHLQGLDESVHYVSSCAPEFGACVRLVQDVYTNLCHNNATHTNNQLCLLLLDSESSVREFYEWYHTSSHMPAYPVASPAFPAGTFRSGFDYVFPSDLFALDDVSNNVKRNRLFLNRSFLIGFSAGIILNSNHSSEVSAPTYIKPLLRYKNLTDVQLRFHVTEAEHKTCWPRRNDQLAVIRVWVGDTGWFPCDESFEVLQNSSFVLILPAENGDIIDFGWNVQLVSALRAGAIPVLIGNKVLPLKDTIPWNRAVLQLSDSQLPDIVHVLSSVSEAHVFELQRQGQILFHRYLKDRSSQVASLLLSVSQRMHLKQPPAKTITSRVVYESFRETNELRHTRPTCSFTRLDSAGLVDPFWSYCTTPWDPPMDMHSSLIDSEVGLNSDFHTVTFLPTILVEKFTVIILTYNRYNSLCQTLKSLINLPYLHSVLVVWNNQNWSPDGLRWPRLHVPLRVIRATKNSLNNRFLPFDLIDTDAVFTVDDDLALPQDEILVAFRAWQENRDRIVGMPSRVHIWHAESGTWIYEWNRSCAYSMVLTGAAFFHKYYLFSYTWEMPSALRTIVDEHMNCEDIAFNFWVAHLTRKAPIHVNNRDDFSCLLCGSGLSWNKSHSSVRSKCITWFANIFGYNPLLYSTFRLVHQNQSMTAAC
ncbi:hypothetical protein EG68_06505 [Paragonimus skrjabini miyazakii]|uniref:Glycosyl transferase 64 domain-containing protein n=1 Tax=Paragonimus skrjabini miyazakii TaxID=59628 RepID=A0A8S9YEF0_9TREM|nr:hypothetical protein EG68_06505 [Paragonimus skrjabini miyazakii]